MSPPYHTAIDRLVYDLYDLTPAEIALVEAATSPQAKVTSEDDAQTLPSAAGLYAQAEVDAAHHDALHEEPKSDD